MNPQSATVSDHTSTAVFAQLLHNAFECDFVVWQKQGDDWNCDGPAQRIHAEEIQRREDGVGFFEAAALPQQEGQFLVCVPTQTGSEIMVGFAVVDAMSDRFLLALARAVQNELQHTREIDRLCDQATEFAVRATRDVETMNFLQRLAGCLDISSEQSLDDVVRHLIPMLPATVGCQWIAYVGTSDFRSRLDVAVDETSVIITEGNNIPSDMTILNLIGTFGDKAIQEPQVLTDLDANSTGVRQVIVSRVFKHKRHWGWLVAANRNSDSQTYGQNQIAQGELGTNEKRLVNSAGLILATHAYNVEMVAQKEDLIVNIVRTLVKTIEAKDAYTRGHSERVAIFARLIASHLGMDSYEQDRVYLAGLLHDIGKVGVPDATLLKPGSLTAEEYEQIKRHPVIGWQMLQGLSPLAEVLEGVLHHHERVDGGGYPNGLAADEIPIDGRILAVADAYDAMTSHRAYRRGMNQEKAENLLREGAGIQWDADVIEALFAVMPEVIKHRQTRRKDSFNVARRMLRSGRA